MLSISQVHAHARCGGRPFGIGSDIQYILQLVDEEDNELLVCVALRACAHTHEFVLMEPS